jgi:methylmalonyl-CoA/ethylmalonyl-CoA epimerase
MKLAHIGIAVDNLNEAAKVFSEVLSVSPDHTAEVPDQKIKALFFRLESGGKVELLVPTDDASPIKKFLDKRGPGIHHLAFLVKDIDAKLEDLKQKGYRLIDQTPRVGAGGKKIAFLHPSSTAGVLIELKEE